MGRPLLLLGFFSLLASCAPKLVPISDPDELEKSLVRIEKASSRISQVKGILDIKGTGLLGQLFHERADVVASEPHYFLWSLRSFFESPAYLIASNGEFITLYDLSGQNAPYEKIPINGQSVVEIFDVSFHPQSLINFFLTRIELKNAKAIQVMRSSELWQIEAEGADGWSTRALFDPENDLFKEITFSHGERKLRYHVQYDKNNAVDGILFPHLFLLSASNKQRTIKLSLEFLQLEINGPKVLPENFFLHAH